MWRALAALCVAAACHGEPPRVVEPPPPPPPPPPIDASEGETVVAKPIEPLGPATQLEDVQHLELARSGPWREAAVARHDGVYSLVLATPAGRFAAELAAGVDGVGVDELAQHFLVPSQPAWIVAVFDAVRDGGKTTILVACGIGRGGRPICIEPITRQVTDLSAEPTVHVEYPSGGGIVLAGKGAPRRLQISE
jgi:hypothetical protein